LQLFNGCCCGGWLTVSGWLLVKMAVKHDRRLSSAVSGVLQPTLNESYVSPRPASRVGTSTDAAKYLRRNRGSSSLWLVKRCGSIDFDDDDDDDNSSSLRVQTARAPRLSGNEASEIFRRSQGSVGVLLDEHNQRGYSSPRPQPRLPSGEAAANARRKADLFTQADIGRPHSSRPERRVLSTEAKANAAKGAGTMNTVLKTVDDQPRTSQPNAFRSKSNTSLSLCLDASSARGETNCTPRPRQRVKPEAQEIAHRSSGKTCAAAIAGRLSGDAVCEVRASGAGRDNYEASTCGSMGALFSKYGQQPAANQLPERIPEGPGKDIARHGKTGTLCYQMNNYGNLPPSPRPESRLRCEGKRFVCRNKGNNMAKCLNPANKPQRRKRLQTGERRHSEKK